MRFGRRRRRAHGGGGARRRPGRPGRRRRVPAPGHLAARHRQRRRPVLGRATARRARTGAVAGPALRARVLRPAAALDRAVRRRRAVVDPGRRRGRASWPGWAPRSPPCSGCPAHRSGSAARWVLRGGAARSAAVRRLPVGTARVQPGRRHRCAGSSCSAARRCSPSSSPWPAVRWRWRRSAPAGRAAAPSLVAGWLRWSPLVVAGYVWGAGRPTPSVSAHAADRRRAGQRPRPRAGLRGPRPPGARQPRRRDHEAGGRDRRRHDAAAPTRAVAGELVRRRPATSTRKPAPRSPARSRRCGCRSWSAPSWTAPARTSAATPASSGRRRPARARSTSSGIRCPSPSTSRCAACRRGSARRPSWSRRTWSPARATDCCAAVRYRSAT